jgi:hypothetical protein
MSFNQNDALNQKMIAFLNGELSVQEAKQLREEIENNEHYARKIDELMLGHLLLSEQAESSSLTEETQIRIIRRGKWKSRFSNIYLNLATLAFIGLIVVGYIYSNFIFSVNWFGPKAADIQRVTSDIIQFTKPGVTIGNSSGNSHFLSTASKFELREQVGRSDKTVGYYEESSVFNKLTSKFNWTNGQHTMAFYFHYPAKQGKNPVEPSRTEGWSILKKLPEGTVAQMAVSFNHLMSHDEYFSLIKKYDLITTWLAVDTGVENNLSQRNDLLGSGLVLGYAPRAMDYSGNGTSTFTIQDNGEADRRTAAYVNELKYLLDHARLTSVLLKHILIDPQLKDITLEQRYQYVKANQVQLYGAIVTGPTKELLKLEQESSFSNAFVGSIDWWNWDQQSVGTEFNY